MLEFSLSEGWGQERCTAKMIPVSAFSTHPDWNRFNLVKYSIQGVNMRACSLSSFLLCADL